MSTSLFQKHKDFFVFLGISFVLALIIFGPSLAGGFTLDDHPVVESRLDSFSFKNFPALFLSPWHPAGEWAGNYRPLTLLSFALNGIISKKTFGFHLVNVFLHALNAALVFWLVKRFASKRAGLVAGLLFLFWPIHTEAVASIVGRVYLLGTFFSLLSLHYFFNKKYFVSSVFFLAALLSGDYFISMVLVLPPLLLWETKNFWKSLRYGVGYIAAVAVYFFCRFLALGAKYVFGGEGYVDPIIGPLAYVGVKERVLTALVYLYLYLRKMIVPIDLSPDYSFNQIPVVISFTAWRFWIGIVVLVAVVGFIWWRRSPRLVKIAGLLFLAAYILMSNLLVVTTGTMAERWWYWPSLGLTIFLALVVNRLMIRFSRWRSWIAVGGSLVFIWYGWISFQQSRFWVDDRHLFMRAVEKSPGSVWARTNLAEEYFTFKQFPQAKLEIEKAMEITDKNPLALYVQGKLYWRDGAINEAETSFLRAIEFDRRGRNRRSLYRTLALLSLDSGQNQKAAIYMLEAVKWPVARQKENILEIDNYLVNFTGEIASRKLSSYTVLEKENLVRMIKTLRGF